MFRPTLNLPTLLQGLSENLFSESCQRDRCLCLISSPVSRFWHTKECLLEHFLSLIPFWSLEKCTTQSSLPFLSSGQRFRIKNFNFVWRQLKIADTILFDKQSNFEELNPIPGSEQHQCDSTSRDNGLPDSQTNVPSSFASVKPIQKVPLLSKRSVIWN